MFGTSQKKRNYGPVFISTPAALTVLNYNITRFQKCSTMPSEWFAQDVFMLCFCSRLFVKNKMWCAGIQVFVLRWKRDLLSYGIPDFTWVLGTDVTLSKNDLGNMLTYLIIIMLYEYLQQFAIVKLMRSGIFRCRNLQRICTSYTTIQKFFEYSVKCIQYISKHENGKNLWVIHSRIHLRMMITCGKFIR